MNNVAVEKTNVLVKVLFHEGDEVRSLRGILKSISEDFVELQTLAHDFLLIKTGQIIKIQALSKGDCDGRCRG